MPPTTSPTVPQDWIGIIIFCAIVRFALFAPLGYYWTLGTTHWDVIRGHPELRNNPSIVTGEGYASQWSTVVFYWNFAVWIPSFWFPPPLSLPFTIVDVAATIYISWTTSYQTGYVPHSKASCAGAAYSWHRPPGANESFFETAGRLNATVATPVNMCRSFVEEWQYGIAVSFFYALISSLNIVALTGALNDGRRQQGKSIKEAAKASCVSIALCLVIIPKGIVLILLGILWFLPENVFRCLPLSFKSKVRFVRRYTWKSMLGLEQTAELGVIELKEMYKEHQEKRIPRYQGGAGQACPLSNFLGIYDILMAVTQEMHYLDIMNLSRVSKSVREVVLPAHDIDRRMEVFRRYTCQGKEKTDCWVCDKQVCTDCQHLPMITQATFSHHLQNCRPCCTPCYQRTVVTMRPTTPRLLRQHWLRPHCQCAPITAHPNIFLRWMNSSQYYEKKQAEIPKVERAVCRECNIHSADKLLEIRERRTELELKRGLQHNGEKWTKCARCQQALGTGPRWWVCGASTCGKECRAIVHQGWGRPQKNETIVGEEAV